MPVDHEPASPSDAASVLQHAKWSDQAAAAKEAAEAEEIGSPSGSVVYRAIYKEGESELERNNTALGWSGLAAGLSMGFSPLTEAILQAHLPDARWAALVAKIGYAAGFLFVILGRQQLYTENTLTVILPLLRQWRMPVLLNVARLWTLVFAANLVGTLLFALAVAHFPVIDSHAQDALRDLSRGAVAPSFTTLLVRGVFAGWLVALMVWLLPFAETARVLVIAFITYIIALAGLNHVIAGAGEVFYAAAVGDIAWTSGAGRYLLASLIGNTVGGVALVAAIKHAQFSGSGETVDV